MGNSRSNPERDGGRVGASGARWAPRVGAIRLGTEGVDHRLAGVDLGNGGGALAGVVGDVEMHEIGSEPEDRPLKESCDVRRIRDSRLVYHLHDDAVEADDTARVLGLGSLVGGMWGLAQGLGASVVPSRVRFRARIVGRVIADYHPRFDRNAICVDLGVACLGKILSN
jgi:hypothetical protein